MSTEQNKKVTLDSITEIAPGASCNVTVMMKDPCQPLKIEPNPELDEWEILDIKVSHNSQLVSVCSVPASVFSFDDCLESADMCQRDQTFSLQVRNVSDVPRRFNFELVIRVCRI